MYISVYLRIMCVHVCVCVCILCVFFYARININSNLVHTVGLFFACVYTDKFLQAYACVGTNGGGVLYPWNVAKCTANYVYDAITGSISVQTAGFYKIYARVSFVLK